MCRVSAAVCPPDMNGGYPGAAPRTSFAGSAAMRRSDQWSDASDKKGQLFATALLNHDCLVSGSPFTQATPQERSQCWTVTVGFEVATNGLQNL